MNSSEGLKGLITFFVLIIIVITSVFGIKLVIESANNKSGASSPSEAFNPKNVKTESSGNSAKIYFETDFDFLVQVEYSENPDFTNSSTENELLSSSKHEINLTKLKPSTTYYFRFRVGNRIYPQDTYLRFDTKEDEITPSSAMPLPIEQIEDTTIDKEPEILSPSTESKNSETLNVAKQLLEDVLKSGKSTQMDAEDDYTGFDQPLEYNQKDQILGAKTNAIGESISKEFKNAVIYKDIRYDFNGDKEVDASDYPLFINFVMNQED